MNIARRDKGLPPIGTVIHHGGNPIRSTRRSFAGLVADGGLQRNEKVTPHWLRHTAATWLMEADAPPWAAAQFMGMTVKTLEEHYGHHRPGYQRDTAMRAGRGGR